MIVYRVELSTLLRTFIPHLVSPGYYHVILIAPVFPVVDIPGEAKMADKLKVPCSVLKCKNVFISIPLVIFQGSPLRGFVDLGRVSVFWSPL